jgi:transposase
MRVSNRKKYDEAFRQGALALLKKSDRTMKSVADGLGIPVATLGYWYKADMAKKKKPPARPPEKRLSVASDAETPEEKIARLEAEVTVLRKRNDELEMDRAILKKAAAFFAKESE